jgi:hypothetical protein
MLRIYHYLTCDFHHVVLLDFHSRLAPFILIMIGNTMVIFDVCLDDVTEEKSFTLP